MMRSEAPIYLDTVLHLSGLSGATLYRQVAAGAFPTPTKQGRRNVWDESAVARWLLNPEQYRELATVTDRAGAQ